MFWDRSWRTRIASTFWLGRSPTSVAVICAWLARPLRAARLAPRTASGAATRAVTSTATNATRHVTSTARAVRVLRIGGVADAADGTDHARADTELGPHLSDVDVDGPGTAVCRVPPHRGEQLLPRVDPAGAVQQVGQQVELGRGERDRCAVRVDGAPLRVEHDRTGLADPGPLGRGTGSAQYRLDPGHQLARAERLGGGVVGALFETEDPVDLVVAGGQEQYRRPVTGRAHPLADLGTGQARQADVEHAGHRSQLPGGG